MASQTPFYGLAYFDFGDELDSLVNVQKEIDRFMLIDRQLYGLYSIFGNGVIEGWDVVDNGYSDSDGISIAVRSGTGIINFVASDTEDPFILNNLPPNAEIYIYAYLEGDTPRDRYINFGITGEGDTEELVYLARIETADASISVIDNSVKQMISFESVIQEEIASHKHRGSPTKIDLKNEVKNQLPGARIESIDAEQITSGVFGEERIPIIDHNDLRNAGLISHAGLDSFVDIFSQSNKNLLGEIATVNLLKTIIFQKYKFSNIDENFINTLLMVPGISPNGYIDITNTTANLGYNCISGKPAAGGEIVSTIWAADGAFESAYSKTNVTISDDNVFLIKSDIVTKVVDDFDVQTRYSGDWSKGSNLPGYQVTTENVNNYNSVQLEDSDLLKLGSGSYFSGKFTASSGHNVIYKKIFSSSQDWSNYDDLILNVKTLAIKHPAVYFYFINGTGITAKISTVFMLLDNDEVTSNMNPVSNNFKTAFYNIKSEHRDSVTELVIYTANDNEPFAFYLDDILVRNLSLYYPQGSIVFRYSTGSPVTFYSISFDASIVANTSMLVRYRIANDAAMLNKTQYSLPISSGSVIALPATNIEIEIIFTTTDNSVTPILKSLELQMISAADYSGFTISDADAWGKGTLHNIDILADVLQDSVQISDSIDVGNLYFSNMNLINEVDNNKFAKIGLSGLNTPVSPSQAYNYFYNIQHGINVLGFNNPVSVKRTFDKYYIVADFNNDRILKLDADDNLVEGFGSVCVTDTDFYVFSVNYNKSINVLTIIASQPVNRSSLSVSRISLFVRNIEVPLNENDKIISSTKNAQIIEIQLSDSKESILQSVESDLTIYFYQGAFPEDIQTSNDNAKQMTGVNGIAVTICNFVYIDGIRHPVCVGETDDLSGYSICNSSISAGTGYEGQNYASFVVINKDDASIEFSSNRISFSDYSLGGYIDYSSNKVFLAGVQARDTSVSSSAYVTNENLTERQNFLEEAAAYMSNYQGSCVLIEKSTGNTLFSYDSPDGLYISDVKLDNVGNIVIAESSFSTPMGRIIKLDSFGNIVWRFGENNFYNINDAVALNDSNIVISV